MEKDERKKGELGEEPGKLQRKRQRTLPRWLSSSQAHQPSPLQRATRPWTLTTNTSHAWPANSRNIATLTFHNKVLQVIKVKYNSSKCLTTSNEYKLEFEREKKGIMARHEGLRLCWLFCDGTSEQRNREDNDRANIFRPEHHILCKPLPERHILPLCKPVLWNL